MSVKVKEKSVANNFVTTMKQRDMQPNRNTDEKIKTLSIFNSHYLRQDNLLSKISFVLTAEWV